MKNKNSYISNKSLYAAVMGACRWIRADGYFNRATKYYADKYDVDVEEVREEVRKRQSVGQKGTKRGSYKYFVVEVYRESEACSPYVAKVEIIKALSARNATKRVNTGIPKGDSYYATCDYGKSVFEAKTKNECENWIKDNTEMIKKHMEE